ncbi:3-hydroxyacyl-CoA dehydrogenase family protein [Calidifontibacillus erzurumensis]|nr:3-hydroxyacyl-CoA dehydrogenase family protein [Calidifontibacillus erzurumensis]
MQTNHLFSKVGVIGSGIMGSGIAQVIAQAGYSVKIFDLKKENLDQAFLLIQKNVRKWCEKKGKTAEAEMIISKLSKADHLEQFNDVDIIIEAVTEKLEVKKDLFSTLEQIVDQETILASNTSGISISKIAEGCVHKERVVGTHFFNPAHKMPLVEIIQGFETSENTITKVIDFVKTLEKSPVRCLDVPGFIVNRIVTPMLNEAIHALEKGIATKEDIDEALKKGMGHPMGPLQLADYIGLDTLLYFMDHVYKETGNEAYKPAKLLRKMVKNGEIGMKTGKGFYQYNLINS